MPTCTGSPGLEVFQAKEPGLLFSPGAAPSLGPWATGPFLDISVLTGTESLAPCPTLVSFKSGFCSCLDLWGLLRYPGQADRRPSSARLPSCRSRGRQPSQGLRLSAAPSSPDFPKQKSGHAI